MKKLFVLAAVLAILLVAATAATAKLSLFSAEQAAGRYAKQHCKASSCTVADCRRLSRSRVDCSDEVWTVYPSNETCFYTLHVSRPGNYGKPSVWLGGLEFCE
jgi:hypothetical protein